MKNQNEQAFVHINEKGISIGGKVICLCSTPSPTNEQFVVKGDSISVYTSPASTSSEKSNE